MKSLRSYLTVAAIVAAATIGDGIFALPYTFHEAGWLVGILYIVILGAIVAVAHALYLKTLEHVGEKKRLLGLSQDYLGQKGFWTGFVAIVVGLIFALVAYLLLGSRFLTLAFPSLSSTTALLLFWACVSLPVFLSDRRVAWLEVVGVTLTGAIVIFVFANAFPHATLVTNPAVQAKNIFLPFGVILLALAGWTGIEPAYEARLQSEKKTSGLTGVVMGTAIVAALYLLFVSGILGSASQITPDTVSGLANWEAWKRYLLAALGICAIATSYLPISRELKNSLEKDLAWNGILTRCVIVFVPLFIILFGVHDFFTVVGISGGIFVSLEYLLIIAVGRQALPLSSGKKFVLDIAALIFAMAFIYEVWFFIVK